MFSDQNIFLFFVLLEGNNGTSGTEPSAPAAETTDENQSAAQDQEQSPRQERSNTGSESNRPSSGQNAGYNMTFSLK